MLSSIQQAPVKARSVTYMKYLSISLILILTLLSCKSTAISVDPTGETYAVINQVLKGEKSQKLVEKSLTQQTAYRSTRHQNFEDYFDYTFLNLNPLVREDGSKIDFRTLLTQEELSALKRKSSNLKEVKFSRRFLDKSVRLVKKRNEKSISLSLPIFTSNRKFAFVFLESSSGASLLCYKKMGTDWKLFSVNTIWIS